MTNHIFRVVCLGSLTLWIGADIWRLYVEPSSAVAAYASGVFAIVTVLAMAAFAMRLRKHRSSVDTTTPKS